jgi:hypothetical protein
MIADFVVEKMSGYVAGGMAPESAARSTMGELSAIYRGRHYSRDTTGVMRLTPPPENIAPEKAGVKCKAAINEILNYCKENAGAEYLHRSLEKDNLSGFEKMAEYAGNPA